MAGGGLKETKDDMAINLTVVDLTSKAPADPVKQRGFYENSGTNTVDQLTNQLLNDNTAANAISSLRASKVVVAGYLNGSTKSMHVDH